MDRIDDKKIIGKVKKLLALADNNPNENEAKNAYLKAQELIAQYNIEMLNQTGEDLEFSTKACTHPNNNGYRVNLGTVIADNFRVKMFLRDSTIWFFGLKQDVEVAVEVFNHAYRYSRKRALQLEYRARKEGKSAKGISNSYWKGFVFGLKEEFDRQCTALKVVTPEEVENEFKYMTKDWGSKKLGSRLKSIDMNMFLQGIEEGKEHLRKTKSIDC